MKLDPHGRHLRGSLGALAVMCVVVGVCAAPAAGQDEGAKLAFREEVVAGSHDDFMEVRHLVLKGSNFAIGKKLAEIARERHGTILFPSPNPLVTRTQRRYLKHNYPIMLERMRGAAAAFGQNLENDYVDCSFLMYLLSPPPGCSVAYYPPDRSTVPGGMVSRNYDFTTGTLSGSVPPPGMLPCTARPYLIEMYPDKGHASLCMYSYDLLGGTLDGINSAGLTVALMADDELMRTPQMEPTRGPGIGLNETTVICYLLDTCANVEEAKAALLMAKQYYAFFPCHYLIADRHGHSFVWEYSHARNREHIIDGGGQAQVVTNFGLHRYRSPDELPQDDHPQGSYNRYRQLRERIAGHEEKCDVAFAKEATAGVAYAGMTPPPPGRPLHRTLWHAIYLPGERAVELDFYLGDKPDPNEPDKTRIVRSGYRRFQLEHD